MMDYKGLSGPIGKAAGSAEGIGSSLSSLEVLLEVGKRISNFRLDFLDCLYDRRPVFERYLAGDVDLHLHGRVPSYGMVCVTLEAQASRNVPFETGVDVKSAVVTDADKVPVFIGVGTITEPGCPLASVVRLQPLNCCDMGGVKSYEESGRVAAKDIWVAFNGKLRAALFRAGIKFSEFEHQIVHSGSEIVENLSDQGSQPHSDIRFWRQFWLQEAMRGIRVMLDDQGVRLLHENVSDIGFHAFEVFACPMYSFKAAIQGVTEVIRRGYDAP